MGVEKNSEQMIISINGQGKVEYKGNLDKRKALKELEGAVLQEESLAKEWLPHDLSSFPRLQLPLGKLLKSGPNKVKAATVSAVNWFLRQTNGKLGRDKFLLWWFPVEKEYLVYVSDLLSGLPEVFNLNMILEWSDLTGCSLSNGNVAALKPASGVTTQIALTKIILNIVFLVVGHNPQTWVLASKETARSSPVLARKTSARDTSTTQTPAPAPGPLTANFTAPGPLAASFTAPGPLAADFTVHGPLADSFTAPGVSRQTSSPAPAGHQPVIHAAPPSPAMSPIIRKRRPLQPNVVGIVGGQQENVAKSKRTFQKPPSKKTSTTATPRYATLISLVKTDPPSTDSLFFNQD